MTILGAEVYWFYINDNDLNLGLESGGELFLNPIQAILILDFLREQEERLRAAIADMALAHARETK